MKSLEPMRAERLFTPFIDSVDGTLCLPASATAAQIRAMISERRMRFPLLLDASATLQEHTSASAYTPASCRFGPYCDNILGINWRLPSGRVARIGERVVKTTTGYDWLRFLLHSGKRYGEPVDYVLRLRPDCGFNLVAYFDGNTEVLQSAVHQLLHSGWMHWWDAVDFIAEGRSVSVRVVVHCPSEEARIFEQELLRVATATSARLRLERPARDTALLQPPFDGLPDVAVKTTPDRAISLAIALSNDAETCTALCYNGVVHVQLCKGNDIAERAHAILQPHLSELHTVGGDWHSRWLPATPPGIIESQWIEVLEQTIHAN
jgi:FAD/FMN-containing dehydrogenase